MRASATWIGLTCTVIGCTGGPGERAPSEEPLAASSSAFAWTQVQMLTPDDHATDAQFAYGMAAQEDSAFLGAHGHEATYVFNRDANGVWAQAQKLVADDGGPDDTFGFAVAVSGDTLVVGSQFAATPGFPLGSGAAYVFTEDGGTWSQAQKLEGSLANTDSQVGFSVDFDGTTIAVGAIGDETSGGIGGAVYLFTEVGGTWVEQQRIVAPSSTQAALFGHSVAVDGDTLVVGERDAGTGPNADAGAAHVFTRAGSTWTLEQTLGAFGGEGEDYFGNDVALVGDRLAVSAIQGGPTDLGAVVIFERSGTTWTQVQEIAPTNFGPSVGGRILLTVDRLYVAATEHLEAGAVIEYALTGGDFVETAVFLPSDATDVSAFGYGLALGNGLLIGAPAATVSGVGPSAGRVYAFSFLGELGDPCGTGSECASTFCADDMCCESACEDGVCEGGTCTPDPIGTGGDGAGASGAGASGAGASGAGASGNAGAGASASGSAAAAGADGGEDEGCGCRMAGAREQRGAWWLLAIGLIGWRRAGRRPRR